jgi:hypothetical protein
MPKKQWVVVARVHSGEGAPFAALALTTKAKCYDIIHGLRQHCGIRRGIRPEFEPMVVHIRCVDATLALLNGNQQSS